MPSFKVRFMLDDEPDKVVVAYIVDSEWEDDAIAEAHERWSLEYPAESNRAFLHASSVV